MKVLLRHPDKSVLAWLEGMLTGRGYQTRPTVDLQAAIRSAMLSDDCDFAVIHLRSDETLGHDGSTCLDAKRVFVVPESCSLQKVFGALEKAAA